MKSSMPNDQKKQIQRDLLIENVLIRQLKLMLLKFANFSNENYSFNEFISLEQNYQQNFWLSIFHIA